MQEIKFCFSRWLTHIYKTTTEVEIRTHCLLFQLVESTGIAKRHIQPTERKWNWKWTQRKKKFPPFVLEIDVGVLSYISRSVSVFFLQLLLFLWFRVACIAWFHSFPFLVSYHHIDIYHAERRYFILYIYSGFGVLMFIVVVVAVSAATVAVLVRYSLSQTEHLNFIMSAWSG